MTRLLFIITTLWALETHAQLPQITAVNGASTATLGDLYLPLVISTLSADSNTPIVAVQWQYSPDPMVGLQEFSNFTAAVNATISLSLPIAPFTLPGDVGVTFTLLDDSGNLSQPFTYDFQLTNPVVQATVSQLEYFFDTDPGFGNGIPIVVEPDLQDQQLSLSLPTTDLTPGEHRLYVRTEDSNGNWGTTYYDIFVQVDLLFDPDCPDLNNDGLVNVNDFLDFLDFYGEGVNGGCAEGDFDGDGIVGANDLLIIIGYFGP